MRSPFDAARRTMITRDLRNRGIRDQRVLEAMDRVPRETFLPESLHEEAYADRALQIDCGQTISQPFMVAMMTEALQLSGNERVLEIGSGSGYQTAILAELAGDVIGLERHADLAREARQRLLDLGYTNVQVHTADGTLGWPSAGSYDRILIAAAAEECPPALLEQLKPGGLLVGPFGPPGEQVLYRYRRDAAGIRREPLTACRFVPLVSGLPSAE